MQKTILFIITFFMFSAQFAVEAQKPKPTPVPKAVIYATDEIDEDGWAKYISTEGKFNVSLPSAPKRAVKIIDSPLGKQTLVIYTATFKKVAYTVSYLDFKVPINDAESLRRIYDNWREGITSIAPNGELEEKDTTVENRLAREISYTAGLMSIRGRTFFAKGKLFQMVAMHLLEGDDALLREASVNNDKFFDSLKLDTITIETKNTDLTGAIRDGSYQNNYFNFKLKLPKDWVIINQEDTNVMKEGSKERGQQQGNKGIEKSFKQTTFLFNLTKNEVGSLDNSSIIGAAESFPAIKATLAQIATAISSNFVKNSGYAMDGAIKYAKVGGTQFAIIKVRKTGLNGIPVIQKLYVTRSKGYLIEFIGTYTKEEDLLIFEEMMKTLKFAGAK